MKKQLRARTQVRSGSIDVDKCKICNLGCNFLTGKKRQECANSCNATVCSSVDGHNDQPWDSPKL